MLLRIREMERKLREAAMVNTLLNTRLCQFEEQLEIDREENGEVLDALVTDNASLSSEVARLRSDLMVAREAARGEGAADTTAGKEDWDVHVAAELTASAVAAGPQQQGGGPEAVTGGQGLTVDEDSDYAPSPSPSNQQSDDVGVAMPVLVCGMESTS